MTTDEERATWTEVLDLTDGRQNDGERWRLVMHQLACMYSKQKDALADATAELERVRNVGSRMNYELLEANGKLADVTARAKRLQRERDRLIEAWPNGSCEVFRDVTGKWWRKGEFGTYGPAYDTKAAAVRAAANLDTPATGEGE